MVDFTEDFLAARLGLCEVSSACARFVRLK